MTSRAPLPVAEPGNGANAGLPVAAGVGYKSRHFSDLMEEPGSVAWLEIHAENYMGGGGRPIAQLKALRERFPISCHGVGLSIGSEAGLDQDHLRRLGQLVDWLEPAMFSEHLAWSSHEGEYLGDLLPLPYTRNTLDRVCDHIDRVQEHVGQTMLLENPSTYLEFEESELEEIEFISEISSRTGCGLLLDVNNVFVSATNRGWDAATYIDSFPLDRVGEIHLGGHDREIEADGAPLLIDSHGCEVADDVWHLFTRTIASAGAIPTLIEWDNNVPDWQALEAEAARATRVLAPPG